MIGLARMAGAVIVLSMLLSAAPAGATLLFGFGNDQGPIKDLAGGGSTSDGPVAITDTDLSNVMRTITVTTISSTAPLVNGTEIAVSGGVLNYAQAPNVFGTGMVEWTFDPAVFSNMLLSIVLIFSDLGGGLDFTLYDGTGSDTFHIVLPAVTMPTNFLINLNTEFAGVDLTNIVGASLFIDGSTTKALDVQIDFIESTSLLPEASTLGLLGLSLIGFGLATRRRVGH